MTYKKQKVKILGHEFWYLPDEEDSPNGPIAPLHHCDDEGNLDPLTMFSTETYAHVFEDGSISRHGEKIGNIIDLLTKE
jgi:hypothetical protein